MQRQIQFKKGAEADINTTATKNNAVQGEPHYTTDTETLCVFNGTKNVPVAGRSLVTIVNAATYDLLPEDHILSVTYTGTGAVTSLTLPTAQTLKGRMVVVKDAGGNAGTNNITIDTEGSELIDGSATKVISTNYGVVTLYSDGTDWFTI